MPMSLKKGALLIADAHYPNHNSSFINFLKDIKEGRLKTPQLILMGDIFDLLVGNSSYLKDKFNKEIELIEEIAKNTEVIYLEGNHDFNLKPLFKNVKVIPIQKQPLILNFQNKTASLAHGDKYQTNLTYKIYTKFIRNPLILKILPDIIAKYKLKQMKNKKICKELKGFELLAQKIAKNHNADLIIEGHYHQGKKINNYISLPSFVCEEKYAIFNGNSVEFVGYLLD